jgi:outer membrane protein assembly factor BamD (BamD/ComL family)
LNKTHAELDTLKKIWIDYPACKYSEDVERRLRRICADLHRKFPDISRKDLYHRARALDESGLREKATRIYQALIRSNRRDDFDAKSRLFLAKIYHDLIM